jgi:hypothetical protein
MLRRLVGFGDEGVPMIYHGLPSPIPDRELSHLLGANRDRVHEVLLGHGAIVPGRAALQRSHTIHSRSARGWRPR